MLPIRKNISLARRIHYRIGGKARYFFEPQTTADIIAAVQWAFERNIPFLFLGAGTNMLFSEKGYDGLVIQNAISRIKKEGDAVRISAGTSMADAVEYFSARGLSDLSWAGGLPGTIGGAVFGNAGCFGGEMKDCVVETESVIYDRATGHVERRVRTNRACAFDYRMSVFKRNENEIITSVLVRATPGDKKEIRTAVQSHIDYRERYQPIDRPSAGSTFKNIPVSAVSRRVVDEFSAVIKNDPFPVIPVAAVLDRLGLKGIRHGGAEISSMHPNFFVNQNKATSGDILWLIDLAKRKARERYGIELEEEIRIVC